MGVYLFNYPYPEHVEQNRLASWLKEIGSPDALIGLDKLYLPEVGGRSWGPGQGAYIDASDPFPLHVIHGPTVSIMVGDDIEKATRDGLVKELRLRVNVINMHAVERINLRVNGTKVPAADIGRVDRDSFEARLQAPPLKRGVNQIGILPGLKCIGRHSSQVTGLRLWVRYK